MNRKPQFSFHETTAPGILIIEKSSHEDPRGEFVKIFHELAYREAGVPADFRECYVSHSPRSVLRGLHFQQYPHEQAKLISVIEGEVLDVCVGVGVPGSGRHGNVFPIVLSRQNNRSLYVPEDYAHGFLVLSERAIVMNHASALFEAGSERGVHYDSFGFDWPVKDPIVSNKDLTQRPLHEVLTARAVAHCPVAPQAG